MATPPLPDTSCVRVHLIYNQANPGEGGNRFYISYSGSAPTPGNCATFAASVGTEWETHIAPLIAEPYELTEVDVIDITTATGNSGQAFPDVGGSRAGAYLPDSVAINVEFGIARRYRGGKPRMYLPPATEGDLQNQSSWTSAFVSAVNTGVEAFFSGIESFDIGSMGTLQHINLSYYQGYTNVPIPGERTKVKNNYRAVALHDNIESYSCKAMIGSQRRRRSSTTP